MDSKKFEEAVDDIIKNVGKARCYRDFFRDNDREIFDCPSKIVVPKKIFDDLNSNHPGIVAEKEIAHLLFDEFCIEAIMSITRHMKDSIVIQHVHVAVESFDAYIFNCALDSVMVSTMMCSRLCNVPGFEFCTAIENSIKYNPAYDLAGTLHGKKIIVNPLIKDDCFYAFNFKTMDFFVWKNAEKSELDTISFMLTCSYERNCIAGKIDGQLNFS